MRKIVISACAMLVAACASTPAVVTETLPPGIAAGSPTFAVLPADAVAQSALAEVQARLQELGYRPSPKPDLIVSVALSGRSRKIGAFVPGACGDEAWEAQRRKPWLIGGGQVTTLDIRMTDSASGRTVYKGSAALRTDSEPSPQLIPRLVSSLLAVDPRSAPPVATTC